MNIFIEEIGTTPNSTGSHLFIDNRPFCMVVEDGHRDFKVPGETRIPAGRYKVVKRTHGKFFTQYAKSYGHKFSIEIQDVPGFTDVLMHIGNTIRDTRGCLLVCRAIGVGTDGNYFGADSTSVYKLLYSLVAAAFERGEEVWLEISRRAILNQESVG